MKRQYDFMSDLVGLLFQSQMLSGVALILWDSLAKPQACEENQTRSLWALPLGKFIFIMLKNQNFLRQFLFWKKFSMATAVGVWLKKSIHKEKYVFLSQAAFCGISFVRPNGEIYISVSKLH